MPRMTTEPVDPTLSPFDKDDSLSRLRTAETIVNLAEYFDDTSTLLIDSGWGTGKSVFARRLKSHLHARGFPTVYFDAFLHDLSDDAFGALAGSLYAELADIMPKAERSKQAFAKAAGKVGRSLLGVTSRLIVKAATAGLLSADDIGSAVGADKDVATATAKLADELGDKLVDAGISKIITEHAETSSMIVALRETLSATALAASKHLRKEISTDAQRNRGDKMFVIIDELDRCRPTFALQIIEVMKHLINSPRVMFVVLADGSQLKNSIRHIYGDGLDAHTYLERFYDLRFTFVDDDHADRSAATRYVSRLKDRLRAVGRNLSWVDGTGETLAQIVQHLPLSFRSIEKIYNRLALINAATTDRHFCPDALITVLLVLEKTNPDLLERARRRQAGWEEIIKSLHIDQWPPDLEPWKMHIICWLEIGLLKDGNQLSPKAQELRDRLIPGYFRKRDMIDLLCKSYLFEFEPILDKPTR